ncbi:MAG: chromosomal replication initiator protein DnaA [Candidatus Sericytochromatia bacterium]|nr:chromosomal replication initiator protein DnaA [Candidatus Tanganyikabacteria bacterium]
MLANELWTKTLPLLQMRMPGRYNSTFQFCKGVDVVDDQFTLEVPGFYSTDKQSTDRPIIEESIYEASDGVRYQVRFRVNNVPSPAPHAAISSVQVVQPQPGVVGLSPRFTFDSFVIGTHNRFAHAAALAVSDKPGLAYNPLFIYGSTGMGKTHLMHAIGQRVLAANPRAKVCYVKSETFTNEVIDGIREDRMRELRRRYRETDVLLIDDIQFIERTQATQEEFFHTFNELHMANKQIVITSDKPPKQLPEIEDRLRSRFESGLLTDIQAPDLDTRIAILRKKADEGGHVVPEDVLDFVAGTFHDSVRALEGAFMRVIAYSEMDRVSPTLELAHKALGTNHIQPITIERITAIVAKTYDVTVEELISERRSQDITRPRFIACYLCRDMTGSSFHLIGRFFRRDHTSIMHGVKTIKTLLEEDPQLAAQITYLRGRVASGLN